MSTQSDFARFHVYLLGYGSIVLFSVFIAVLPLETGGYWLMGLVILFTRSYRQVSFPKPSC